MNRKFARKLLFVSLVSVSLSAAAAAEYAPYQDAPYQYTSAVPTAPMVTREQQQANVRGYATTSYQFADGSRSLGVSNQNGGYYEYTPYQAQSSTCNAQSAPVYSYGNCNITRPQSNGNCTTGSNACNNPYSNNACPTSGNSCTLYNGDCPGTTSGSCRPSSNCADGNRPTNPSIPSTPDTDDGYYTPGVLTSQEQILLNMINSERVSRGINAVAADQQLVSLARQKSLDMIQNGYFAHESPTYGNASEMLTNAGYSFKSVGENIAKNANVDKAHAALMSSTGHRTNILGSQWTKVGIGVVNDFNGYPYITQLFVR